MVKLSILIPARNEEWLGNTIDDILAHTSDETEVIAVLDGAWPVHPIKDHPRVNLIYHPVSIGQRAAINEAARVASGKYYAKMDAHVLVSEGFDQAIMKPYESGEIGMDTTTIPRLYNLHAFNWLCDGCGFVTYQGPKPELCAECGCIQHHRDVVWKPRLSRRTDFARFDTEPKYQYWPNYERRPEAKGDIADVMCCLGACFVMSKDWFWHLGGSDERHGSWGSQGIETCCASWLCGGRVVVNKRAWYSHLFRTQPGFGFPYAISGKDQQKARDYSRRFWFGNKHPKQVRPLSWLLDKFAPVPVWHEATGAAVLAEVTKNGSTFILRSVDLGAMAGSPRARSSQGALSVGEVELAATGLPANSAMSINASDFGRQKVSPDAVGLVSVPSASVGVSESVLLAVPSSSVLLLADEACSHEFSGGGDALRRREQVPPDAVRLASIDNARGVRPDEILLVADERKVDGVAASPVAANKMVNNGDVFAPTLGNGRYEPSVDHAMKAFASVPVSETPVPGIVFPACPQPASGVGVDLDLLEDPAKLLAVQGRNVENALSHDSASCAGLRLEAPACENHVGASLILPSLGIVYYTNHKLDPHIFNACKRQLARACNGHHVVSVSWEPMAFGENIVYKPGPSPHVNYFSQITLGLERLQTDYVAMCEHDVLYDPSHLTFRPPTDDAYWYNEHCWRVDAATGRAVTHSMRSVSGLVAYRELLLEHYRKMLAHVKAKGYWYKVGHEPGVFPGRAPGVDAFPAMGWRSWRPNADLRHGLNMTGSRWSPDKFTVPPSGWQESDGVPGWGRTLGRFDAWLEEVTR